jgi:glutamyl-tRNA synthetase
VVRGEDLLKSTARQLLLYRALGLAAPAFFHCPLVRDADGRRLAKRTDGLSIRALRERGHTPAEVLVLAGLQADSASGLQADLASGFPEAGR